MTSRMRIVFSVWVMSHSICRNEFAYSYVISVYAIQMRVTQLLKQAILVGATGLLYYHPQRCVKMNDAYHAT